ncbi:hypothetical protein NDU88_006426 [Pleurodeles waltl]|uniref:Uncharacterized protein n=1 Tax=Pleurodeles waltl TaxID=8319 RepID=A0AAV7UPM3_PLEWA|nr:hypothetical protein NDU88_006426 [Pleurodeles waltl]
MKIGSSKCDQRHVTLDECPGNLPVPSSVLWDRGPPPACCSEVLGGPVRYRLYPGTAPTSGTQSPLRQGGPLQRLCERLCERRSRFKTLGRERGGRKETRPGSSGPASTGSENASAPGDPEFTTPGLLRTEDGEEERA